MLLKPTWRLRRYGAAKSGGKPLSYVTNGLSIMVSASNPRQIHSLQDLGRADVRLSMPNPQWEGIAKQIGDSLRKAGGEALFHAVYEAKVQDGSSYLTQIHHRQTAMRIMKGESDAGVTWSSEVIFRRKSAIPSRAWKFQKIKTSRRFMAQPFCSMLRIRKRRALGWLFSIPPKPRRFIRNMGSAR